MRNTHSKLRRPGQNRKALPVPDTARNADDAKCAGVENVDREFHGTGENRCYNGGCYIYIEFGFFKVPV